MIISRTPFRISFFGGGTDYPEWYLEHGGQVLASAIDKYCYLTVRYLPPFFEHKTRIIYSQMENVSRVEEIKHPAVRAILQYLQVEHGVEIHHDADLPARSGIGSSSSFAVGLLHALHALQGRMMSKYDLAMQAIHIEQVMLKETVGSQDQFSASYGGLNHIRFHPGGEISVAPIVAPRERIEALNDHIMLFYTGILRTATDVASSYVHNINDRRRQLRLLSDLCQEAIRVLSQSDDLTGFGEILHEGWEIKRSLSSKVTNHEVDEIYSTARKNGAIGGKLTGAGGGGFMLLFAPPDRHRAIRKALASLIFVPVKFDFNGSQIIFLDHQEDYSDLATARADQKISAFRELSNQED
jgi:D-glycero-alpha-D-manno-heptose-7-phosphate kinase